jgi:Ring finger domain
MVRCMICSQEVVPDGSANEDVIFAFAHHIQHDPVHTFYVTIIDAFYSIPLYPDSSNILDTLFDSVDNDTYESLLDLCNEIGNVNVGIENLDDVSEIIVTDREDPCPICLEKPNASTSIRRIHVCGHRYCDPCISTWLQAHKTCPVCKTECLPKNE